LPVPKPRHLSSPRKTTHESGVLLREALGEQLRPRVDGGRSRAGARRPHSPHSTQPCRAAPERLSHTQPRFGGGGGGGHLFSRSPRRADGLSLALPRLPRTAVNTSLVGKDENGKWRSAGSDEYTSNLCGRLAHIVLDDEVMESLTPATPDEEPAGGGGEDFTTTVTISGDVNENEPYTSIPPKREYSYT